MILQTVGGTRRNKTLLDNCFKSKDYPVNYEEFSGECTRAKIDAWVEKCKKDGITAVIGIGGNKVLDTAKRITCYTGFTMVMAPAVCATNAPCSLLSVMYTSEGMFGA